MIAVVMNHEDRSKHVLKRERWNNLVFCFRIAL
jgi:hypothetical protein